MAVSALCIHGHFYQPPREDPFTAIIPSEIGAEPFSNWNERIHAECYRPNAIQGNFERISFNVGPTLFEWMLQTHPQTAGQIVNQDQANVRRHGVGNAMAQPYHHTILPLATRRDKETQVYWGIAQFINRFGRKPQGMWLPETAVDTETLEVLAEHDITYIILAPWQSGQSDLDTGEAYKVALPSGKEMNVLFFHPELSAGISFNPAWTTNADQFVTNQVQTRINQERIERSEDQILLIASDGELYGHHQQFRDYFLAHLMNGASEFRKLEHTYPGLWIAQHPPRQLVTIRENTSWSCHHGVARWKNGCGCTQGEGIWKRYLRQACDRLAHDLDDIYCQEIEKYQVDAWKLRNQYVHCLLNEITVERFITEKVGGNLTKAQADRIAVLLEAQHHRHKMFASCGWFFDDFGRIEPKNCLAYAAQSVILVEQATGINLAKPIKKILRHVISHRTGQRGDDIFRQHCQKAKDII
jgi:alpha-amylase/alpha-mannosidase (GH57 family)